MTCQQGRRRILQGGAVAATGGLAGCLVDVIDAVADDEDEANERETYDSITVTVSAPHTGWRGDIRFVDGDTFTRVPMAGETDLQVTVPDHVPEVERVQSPVHVSISPSYVDEGDDPFELRLEVEGEEVGRERTTEEESVSISHP